MITEPRESPVPIWGPTRGTSAHPSDRRPILGRTIGTGIVEPWEFILVDGFISSSPATGDQQTALRAEGGPRTGLVPRRTPRPECDEAGPKWRGGNLERGSAVTLTHPAVVTPRATTRSECEGRPAYA